jgi:hypothetical protein
MLRYNFISSDCEVLHTSCLIHSVISCYFMMPHGQLISSEFHYVCNRGLYKDAPTIKIHSFETYYWSWQLRLKWVQLFHNKYTAHCIHKNGLCFDKIISLYFCAPKTTTIDIGGKEKVIFRTCSKTFQKWLIFRLIWPSYEKNIIWD